MSELERLRALRDEGRTDEYVSGVLDLAARASGDVDARIEAAYACDRYRSEEEAIVHYDAAWRLGVPEPERRRFLVGYGSTLRNVGRHEESVAILGEAVAEFPGYAPLEAFLGLALHSAGHRHAAVATLLGLVLDLADRGQLDGYERALSAYQHELLDEATR